MSQDAENSTATQCPICSDNIPQNKRKRSRSTEINIQKIRVDLRHKRSLNDPDAQFLTAHDFQTCNNCYYSTLTEDFDKGSHNKEILLQQQESRKEIVQELFGTINFSGTRTLEHTMLAAILGVDSYQFFKKEYNPTFKKAVCALRASWYAKDLYLQTEKQSFHTIHAIFQRKAAKYYTQAFERAEDKTEEFNETQCTGPDINQNWGYNGLLYITSYFTYLIATHEKEQEKAIKLFEKVRNLINTLQSRANDSNTSRLLVHFGKTMKRLSNEKLKTFLEDA